MAAPEPASTSSSIAVVCGTRPEVIKLAGIIRLLGPDARVVHSGQHYTPALAQLFLDQLHLGEPAVQLDVGGVSRAQQIAATLRALDDHLAAERPHVVVVQGDTNTTLGAALTANSRGIPLVHVEAGLRSFDREMPEEHNRVLVDHLADRCLAPTEVSRANLAAEGIGDERVVVTGNTVIEAVQEMLPAREERSSYLRALGVHADRFVLSTFHRPENVDDPETLETILRELAGLPLPVVLPLHPRTAARAADSGLGPLLESLVAAEPMGYREFLGLAAESALLVSDSGGVQEEASVLKRPVVVVRRSTERPEVLGTFAELVEPGPAIGEAVAGWLHDLESAHRRLADLPSPYGDGTASERSVAVIRDLARSPTSRSRRGRQPGANR